MATFRHPVPILVQRSLAALGGRVAVARKARGMTQVQLAFSADVGVSTVAALETSRAAAIGCMTCPSSPLSQG